MLSCYQKMYAIVCSAASEAVDILEESQNTIYAAAILQKALREAEELYICKDERTEA